MNDIFLGSNPPPVEFSEVWKNNLKSFIRKELEKSGTTQSRYASEIGVPQTYISLVKNSHWGNVSNSVLKELAIKSGFMEGYIKPVKAYNPEVPKAEKAVEFPNELRREQQPVKPKDLAEIDRYLDKRELTNNLVGSIKQDFRHFLLQDLVKKLDAIRSEEL